MSQHFHKPFQNFGGNINMEVDISNYATITDLKNVKPVGTSRFALKPNLSNVKTEVHKLEIDKLVPVDLSNLSDDVKNDIVTKSCV